MNIFVLIFACLFLSPSLGQYHAQYRSQDLFPAQQSTGSDQVTQEPTRQLPVPAPMHYNHVPTTPTPAILLHKQSLSHDGGFNFAFSADNGLQHGESIQPDGTRSGGYSYVDPNGKTISVRYTAGKDGFKILQGDHVPGSNVAGANQPVVQPETHTQQVQPSGPAQYSYEPQIEYSGPQTFSQEQYQPQVDGIQYRDSYRRAPVYAPNPPRYLSYKNTAPNANAIQQQPDYYDEPGKPHSFGNGYSFEFSG